MTHSRLWPQGGKAWLREAGREGGWARRVLPPLALGVAIMLVAWGSIALPREISRTTPLWPANAIVLAVLLRTAPAGRRWQFLAAATAGNLLADLLAGDSLALSAALTACNTLEISLGALVLRRVAGPDRELDLARGRDLLAFGAVSGVAAPLICASLATWALGAATGPKAPYTLLTWAAADGMGAMVFTPLLLTLSGLRRQMAETPVTWKGVVALLFLAVICAVVFSLRLPLAFLIPLTLLAATFQLEMLGAVVGVLIVAITALAFTLTSRETMITLPGGLVGQTLLVQVFLLSMILISLPTAMALTQRRRFASAASEQQRWAGQAEEVAGVGYWRVDAATLTLSWSDGMYRIFGVPKSAGQPTLDAGMAMLHPDDRERLRAGMKRALETGETLANDGRLVRPDGAVRYAQGRAACQFGPDGKVEALIGTMLDVTDQKLALSEAARSVARFRTLANSVSDIICESNLEGVYTYVSPACLAITGYTSEELEGQGGDFFVHPDDLEMVQSACRELFAHRDTPPPVYLEYRIVRKDGAVTWLESRPVLSRDPITGKVIGFIDCAREVSVRKALEAELETARREAIEAAEVKAAFLANMSHELRTPLTSVLGFTRLALDQPELGPVSRDYIRKASNGGAALLATVNDILDFSKLEAGQVEIRPRPTEVGGLIRDTLELFSESAAAKGLTLTLMARDLPAAVELDPDRLRQLLLNLVGNAVKFSEAGEVRIEAAWKARDGVLRVDVIDQGPGLSKEQQSLLFLRFSQIDGSLTRRHGGTGLGLAICRGLVEAMGGRIGVRSAVGKGARFHFEFPAPRAEAAEIAETEEEAIFPDGARVLVVDDHRVNRELVRAILIPLGAQISEAEDGAEAVEKAGQAAFDLILMDLRMPGLDGTGAMQAIRAGGGPNAATPILAFSADADGGGEARRRALGFNGDVLKPLTPANLIALAAHHLAAAPASERAVA